MQSVNKIFKNNLYFANHAKIKQVQRNSKNFLQLNAHEEVDLDLPIMMPLEDDICDKLFNGIDCTVINMGFHNILFRHSDFERIITINNEILTVFGVTYISVKVAIKSLKFQVSARNKLYIIRMYKNAHIRNKKRTNITIEYAIGGPYI